MSPRGPELLERPRHVEADIPERRIPKKHQESMIYTKQNIKKVGGELEVQVIKGVDQIPAQPGVYIFGGNSEIYEDRGIVGARCELVEELISGRADSAHAVLPIKLGIKYGDGSEEEIDAAAKGYYKRLPYEKLERVKREVAFSHQMAVHGELAYEPLAVIIAPSLSKNKNGKNAEEEFDVILITKFESDSESMDNNSWHQGYTMKNLLLADRMADAMGFMHAVIGIKHGDGKSKNFINKPGRRTSGMDFETSEPLNRDDPVSVGAAIQDDLGKNFTDLEKRGFFYRQPDRARDVMERMVERYLMFWGDAGQEVQDAAFEQAIQVVDRVMETINQKANKAAKQSALEWGQKVAFQRWQKARDVGKKIVERSGSK